MQCHLLVGGATVLLVTAVCLAEPPTPPDPVAQEIHVLIRQLGDPSFEVREAATRRLLDRPEAAQSLQRALKLDDAEVRRRAESILAEFARRAEKRLLTRLTNFAKNGEVDLALELLVRRPTWSDEEDAWQAITGLAQALIDLGAKDFDGLSVPQRQTNHRGVDPLAAGDFRRYLGQVRPKLQTTGRVDYFAVRSHRVVVRAEEIEAGECDRDLLVSAGAIHKGTDKLTRRCGLYRSVPFAGGPVDVESASGSVIVCDGNFTADDPRDCLIVARGTVRCKSTMTGCRVFAGGDVECPRGAGNCGIVAGGKVTLSQNPRNNFDTEVKEGNSNLMGFVKWFDPTSVGVAVETAEGGVKVKQADEGKPFATSGLRAGDLAVAADGKKIESPDAFRLLLRAKVVMREELTLEVRRDGKPIKLTVDFTPVEPPKK